MWIDVKQAMPKLDVEVLVWDGDERQVGARYAHLGEVYWWVPGWPDDTASSLERNITHWHTLPDPPLKDYI